LEFVDRLKAGDETIPTVILTKDFIPSRAGAEAGPTKSIDVSSNNRLNWPTDTTLF
jgi:hypothetical protein